MAENFAPPLKNNEPENFLNYSRGYEDRSGSTLFRGLGEALDDGIKAVDRGLTQRVQDEVRAAVENADAALGINANPRTENPNALPEEVVSKIERLRINREAMLAGRLNPEHYYARLHTESKKIRQRWGGRDGASGYTEQIDNAFKELIGTTPANALRRELQAQAEAATRAAQSSRDDNERFIDSLITQGRVPAKYLSVISNPEFRGNPQMIMQLKADVAAEQAYNATIEREQNLLSLKKARGEDTSSDSAKLYGKEAFKIVNDTLEVGTDYRRMSALIDKARDQRESGRTMNPEELGQIRNLWGQIKQNVQAKLARKKLEYGVVAGKEVDQYDSQINSILNDIEKGLTDQNVGLLQSAAADAKVLQDTGKAELLGFNETMKTAAALRDTMGDTAYGIFLGTEAGRKYVTEIANYAERAVAVDAASGEVKSLVDSIRKNQRALASDDEAAKEQAKFVSGSIDKVVNGIFDERIDSVTRTNLFNATYGPENQRMWISIGADRKRKMMLKLASPSALKAIKKLAAETGDDSIMTNYDKTLANLSFETAKPHIDTLNEIGESVSNKRVDFDPSTNRIRVVGIEPPAIGSDAGPLGNVLRSGAQTMLNTINAAGVVEAEEDVNTVLAAHEAKWTAEGISKEDQSALAVQVLDKLGLNLGSTGRNILERALGERGRKNVPPGMMRAGGLTEADVAREQVVRGRQVSPRAGTELEIDEAIRNYNEANDPQIKALFKEELFNLLTLEREKMSTEPAPIKTNKDGENR